MYDRPDCVQPEGARPVRTVKSGPSMPQLVIENFHVQLDELTHLRERMTGILIQLRGHGQNDDRKVRGNVPDVPEPQGIFNIFVDRQNRIREVSGNLMALAADIENALGI